MTQNTRFAAGYAAAAYDALQVASLLQQPGDELLKEACVAIRDSVMLCCLLVTVHGDRSSLEREYEHAFGRKLGTDLESQMLLSYHKVMQQVPGRFLSKREVCKRQRTYLDDTFLGKAFDKTLASSIA